MNRKLFSSLAIVVFTVLLGFGAVHAQTLGAYSAEIPFDFVVGDQVYAAGEYKIKVASPNYIANLLTVNNAEGRDIETFALATNGDRSKDRNARLVFYQDGEDFVLKQIIGPRFGFTVPKHKIRVTAEYDPGPQIDKKTVSVLLRTTKRN